MNTYKGSFIGVGLVYSKADNTGILNCINFILSEFLSDRYAVNTYFEKDDLNYGNVIDSYKKINIEKLISADYFTVCFDTIYNGFELPLILSSNCVDGYFSVQIDFREEAIYCCLTRAEVLSFFERLIVDVYKSAPFVYAYCDNEPTFDCVSEEPNAGGKNCYSVVVFPKGEKVLKIIRQKWTLNGYTERDKSLVGEFNINIE